MNIEQLMHDLKTSTDVARKATNHIEQLLNIIYLSAKTLNLIALNKGEICPEMVAQDSVLKINALMIAYNQKSKISNDE